MEVHLQRNLPVKELLFRDNLEEARDLAQLATLQFVTRETRLPTHILSLSCTEEATPCVSCPERPVVHHSEAPHTCQYHVLADLG